MPFLGITDCYESSRLSDWEVLNCGGVHDAAGPGVFGITEAPVNHGNVVPVRVDSGLVQLNLFLNAVAAIFAGKEGVNTSLEALAHAGRYQHKGVEELGVLVFDVCQLVGVDKLVLVEFYAEVLILGLGVLRHLRAVPLALGPCLIDFLLFFLRSYPKVGEPAPGVEQSS